MLCNLTIGTIRETKEKCEHFYLLIQNQNDPIRSSSIPLPSNNRAHRDNEDAEENTMHGITGTIQQTGGKRPAVPKSVCFHSTLKPPTIC